MGKLTRGHVLDEAGEEGLFLEVGVVLLEVSLAGRDELHGGELEAAALEARDDLTDETCGRVYVFSLLAWGRLRELGWIAHRAGRRRACNGGVGGLAGDRVVEGQARKTDLIMM